VGKSYHSFYEKYEKAVCAFKTSPEKRPENDLLPGNPEGKKRKNP
jgi:hypothetical protein